MYGAVMISKYEMFLKIIECGGLTNAAMRLGYSQPAASHMLTALEKELGFQLLVRTKTGIQLTSEGRRLLPLIKSLCADYDELLRIADEIRGVQSGLIRIGVFPSVAVNWLPNIIKYFHQDFPKVDFELLYGDYGKIEEWIRSGDADCGFLRYPVKSGIDGIFVEEDRMMLVIPGDYSLAASDSVTHEIFEKESVVLLKEGPENEFMEIFKSMGVSPKICFTAWDIRMVEAMVENGLGVSLLPELSLRRSNSRISIKPLPGDYTRKLCVAAKDFSRATALVKEFVKYIKYRNGLAIEENRTF